MHSEVLSNKQAELLPLIKSFSKHFYLVGDTAIGLQIGHRQSIDFDLFSNKLIKPNGIKNQLKNKNIAYEIIHQEYDQLHLSINNVKLFRQQLAYFKDIDYSEAISYLREDPKNSEIEKT